ncbi:VWA domain-containing protein [Candidatus Bathyarchaeota archaeon]|nr:VWA domain-containing protein [Candidatus Bathyarchaeota archaeon]
MELNKLRSRRGMMRVLEAILACSLILMGHYVISHSNISTYTTKNSNLEAMGQNLLNTLEDQELILSKEKQGPLWESSLRELIESLLPPDVVYDVSIESLVTGEIIAENITNLDPGSTVDYQNTVSVQGIYTFSYPLIKVEDVLLDIVLIVDRSGSMDDAIQGDVNNKIYYAKEASCNFVDRLNVTTDKVGLVSFSTTSTVDSSLTFNHEGVKTDINSLNPNGWTDIGAGIHDANQEFDVNGRYNSSWIIVLLSDGITNTYDGQSGQEALSREYALNQSQESHDMGIKVYTIGLGDKEDIDEELLQEIKTAEYFYAPSASELDEIYQAIAEDLIYEVKYDILRIDITLRGDIH